MPDLYKAEENPKLDQEPMEQNQNLIEEESSREESVLEDQAPNTQIKPQSPIERESSTKCLWSFYLNPKNVRFETQDPDEQIIMLLRKHPVTNIWWILIAALLLLIPGFFDSYSFLPFLPRGFHFVASLLWYLVTTAFILESFLSWFFNVYIVTDERIIDVDFHNLIYREISETKIDKIQDVTFTMGGVMSAFFNYGNVTIQTAGTVPNFDFQAVPEPSSVVKMLQQLRTEEEKEAIEGRIR